MNTQSVEVVSLKDVANSFSEGLPTWQQQANLTWLTNLHGLMSEGGVWGSPNLGTIYQKRGAGWVLLEDLSNENHT